MSKSNNIIARKIHLLPKFNKPTLGIFPYQYVIDERVSVAHNVLEDRVRPEVEIGLV